MGDGISPALMVTQEKTAAGKSEGFFLKAIQKNPSQVSQGRSCFPPYRFAANRITDPIL
jgi:hypothetical protein